MRPRSIPALLLAICALLLSAAPALGFGAGTTFLTGGLELPAGAIAGANSGHSLFQYEAASVSRNGRFVAFVSDADTLDPAAHPDATNVFRKDRLTGAVVLVSRATGAGGGGPDASSTTPVISSDGTRVSFVTQAALDPADADGGRLDVYVRDVEAGTTTLATPGTAADVPREHELSGDGRYVAFSTTSALDAANDANGLADVYVRDLLLRTTTLVSRNTLGRAAAGASEDPSISDDGAWVAFTSRATDLLAGYTPGVDAQVFARDMTAARTYLVSASMSSTAAGANGRASEPVLAGRPASGDPGAVVVAWTSEATDVDIVDVSNAPSVYVRRLSAATSTLVSRADGGPSQNADGDADSPAISDSGDVVVFSSDASNLGAGNYSWRTYVRTVSANTTRLLSADNRYANRGAISGEGNYAVWNGYGTTADSDPDLQQVFGRTFDEPSTFGAFELVSRPPGTAPFLASWIDLVDEDSSGLRTVSADGRYIVFVTYATRLPDALGGAQVYRRDLVTGATELVSRATGAAGAAGAGAAVPSISADGMRVAFTSRERLDPAHPVSTRQAYVRDFATATTTLVSRADDGAIANDDAANAAISADGTRVVFASDATNLGVPGGIRHLYLRDVAGGRTLLVDRANGAGGTPGDGAAETPSLSRDGRWVAFESQAGNLDPADPDRSADVFLRDTVAGTTLLLSRRSGLAGAHAVRPSYAPSISADGAVVAFEADDEALAPEGGGWGARQQVVARTVATGANVLVSRGPGGEVANAYSANPSVSGDGAVIAFDSAATNLLAGLGGGGRRGVFARTMATGALSGPPAFGLVGSFFDQYAVAPMLSEDGQCMSFTAKGHNAATGTAGDGLTSYMYVVSGACPKPTGGGGTIEPKRPRLSRASLSHKRFRVGRRATARSAAVEAAAAAKRRRPRRAPVGTTVRFTLSTRANVTIAIERPASGRLVGRFCKRPTRRLRRHLRCVRFVRVGQLVRSGRPAGASRIAFSGRVGRRALKPGAYRARVRASNRAGASGWATLRFRVVR